MNTLKAILYTLRLDDEPLELPGGKTPALKVAKERYRELAAMHHPDKGGSAEMMATITQSYEELVKILEKRKDLCQGCEGKGHIEIRSGFNSIRKRCRWCRGTGEEQ